MLDPFADPEMRERAAKLLRLLESDAAGEADAARAALLRLLARHGASLDDLTQRLLAPVPDDLPALRAALAAAEHRAALAEFTNRAALAQIERLRASATLARIIAVAVGGTATLLLAVALLPSSGGGDLASPAPRAISTVSAPPVEPAPPPRAPAVPASPPPRSNAPRYEESIGQLPPLSEFPAPAQQPGAAAARRGKVVAPEGVLLRLDPVPGVPSVALLPLGTTVIIDQAFPMLGTNWMQVRTPMGAGFVPASTIKTD